MQEWTQKEGMAQRRGFSHPAQEAAKVQEWKLGIRSWLESATATRSVPWLRGGRKYPQSMGPRQSTCQSCRFPNQETFFFHTSACAKSLHVLKEDGRQQDCAGGSCYRGCLLLRGFGFHAFLPSHVISRPDCPPTLALSAEICPVGRHFLEEHGLKRCSLRTPSLGMCRLEHHVVIFDPISMPVLLTLPCPCPVGMPDRRAPLVPYNLCSPNHEGRSVLVMRKCHSICPPVTLDILFRLRSGGALASCRAPSIRRAKVRTKPTEKFAWGCTSNPCQSSRAIRSFLRGWSRGS